MEVNEGIEPRTPSHVNKDHLGNHQEKRQGCFSKLGKAPVILPEMFFCDVDNTQEKHPASKYLDHNHERDHKHCLVTDCSRVNKLGSQQNKNGISNATNTSHCKIVPSVSLCYSSRYVKFCSSHCKTKQVQAYV